jgi:hypothetical protein
MSGAWCGGRDGHLTCGILIFMAIIIRDRDATN